jgi:transcriptional regulator with XRE-family HTH domain
MVENKLKQVRNERGLSQLRLALLTGIAPSELSRIENGWIRPYPGWRKRLARALGTTEAELFPAERGEQDGN